MTAFSSGPGGGDLIENLPAAVYVLDAEGRLGFFNRAMVELTGSAPAPGGNGLSLPLKLFLPDGTPLPPEAWPMTAAFQEKRAIRAVETVIARPDGRCSPFIAYAMPLRDAAGQFSGTINMLADISDRVEAEANSRTLLNRFIHRERNEIQTIQSLLASAQREAIHPEAKDVLTDTSRRVGAVAAAQSAIGRPGGSFDVHHLLASLCQYASQSFGPKLDIGLDNSTGVLPNRVALPLAIIVNELVSNAVRHGRGERNHVAVRISLTASNGEAVLTVQDDGPGFQPEPPKRRASGLGLVEGLARQLGGSLEVTAQQGARCVLRFAETSEH